MTDKTSHTNQTATSELLVLPDGRVLVHNLTPAFATVLRELNPQDAQIAPRAADLKPVNAYRRNELSD